MQHYTKGDHLHSGPSMRQTASRDVPRYAGRSTTRGACRYLMLSACLLMVLLLSACTSFASNRAEVSAVGEEGLASYYSDRRRGRKTASGDRYNRRAMTAAHRTLPFGTRVRVRDLETGREVTVRINDRGPFVKGRIIDLSRAAAERLGLIQRGVGRVRVTTLE